MLEGLNKRSQTWLAIKEHLEGRLTTLRARAETDNLPDKERENAVGRINEIKEMLALADDKPEFASTKAR